MDKAWPSVSLKRAQDMLTAPGSFFEMHPIRVADHMVRVWKHAPETLRDMFVRARSFGPREFLVAGTQRASFEAFARASLTVAATLMEQGLQRGERVAIAMRNVPEWPVVFFGAALAGAIVAPLNAWGSGEELAHGLSDSAARFAFVDDERLNRITPHLDACSGLQRLWCLGTPPSTAPTVSRLEDVIGPPADWSGLAERPLPDLAMAPQDTAAIFYTSGTLGPPRGVELSHRNLISSTPALGYALAHAIVRAGGAVPDGDFLNDPQRAVLLTIPLFHVTGTCAVLNPALFIGAKLVLMRKWDAAEASRLIECERISQLWGVPTTIETLLDPALARYDRSSLRLVSYGGAPAAPDLVHRIKAAIPQTNVGCGWGMTETAAICTSHSGGDYIGHPTSCGLAAPVCDIKLMNAEGTNEVPPGTVGELWVRGPNVAKGYWQRPAETAAVFVDGWVRTGDLAHRDADGYCIIVDRAKDMLIRGGENISCIEVEHVLAAHPAVAEAAVIPLKHRLLGEEPAAIVFLKTGAKVTEAALKSFVATHLAAFKVPVKIEFWPKSLPRNAAGKLARALLKKLFSA